MALAMPAVICDGSSPPANKTVTCQKELKELPIALQRRQEELYKVVLEENMPANGRTIVCINRLTRSHKAGSPKFLK